MNRKGQNTIEYILLVTAVIATIVVMTKNGGLFQTRLTNTVNTTMSGMEKEAQKLTNSVGN